MATRSRADDLTGSARSKEFFSDFVTSFAKTPFSNQLGKVTNEKSVSQSLRNLVLTNLGERFFQPGVGSDITALLFQPHYQETLFLMSDIIKNMIRNNEPRAEVQQVYVKDDPESNAVEFTIVYNLINNPEPITLNILLKRVR